MSEPIFEQYVDERGNISVRVSHDVQMLTREEADRIEAEYKRMQAENAKLRELARDMYKAFMHGNCYRWCEFKEPCNYISDGKCQWYDRMRELGVEVDA